jgi:hypothetical protein
MTPTQLAFQYLTLQPSTRMALIAGLMLAGGLASALFASPKARLGRAPYFALATGLNVLLEMVVEIETMC